MRSKAMLVGSSCLLSASLLFYFRHAPAAHAVASDVPAYTANGDMLPVADYREWIYLSSGVDMSYTARAADMTMFDNVFVNGAAYRSFLATGTWPDKTVMVLESLEAKNKGSINQQGHFQGTSIMGIEVHVKDVERFPRGWAFFNFDSPTAEGKLFPPSAACYSCHRDHGAVDTTFVQFYPTLMPIARGKKTLSAAYLKEEAAQPAGN